MQLARMETALLASSQISTGVTIKNHYFRLDTARSFMMAGIPINKTTNLRDYLEDHSGKLLTDRSIYLF